MSSRARTPAAFAALAATLTLFPGCGGPDKPAAVPATGKVVYKKTTPAAGALVVFHPADGGYEKTIGGKPFATVKDDGTFALTTYAEGDGAPEGTYGVTVDWQKKPAGKMSLGSGEGGRGGGVSALSPKYGNPKEPAFKFTVKKGEKNEFLIEVD